MWEGYFDGACDNNGSKEMQIGAVLIHDGLEIERISRRIGKGTSNIAEYAALIALLECIERRALFYDIDRGEMWIRGDSKLVINQIKGRWRVRAPHLLEYRDQARKLNQKIRAKFDWIPRERNAVADKLSKLAPESSTDRMKPRLVKAER